MSARLTRRMVSGGAIAVIALPFRARAAKRRVRFGQNNGVTSPGGVAAEAFAAAVAADPSLQNSLTVAVYHDGALGDELAAVYGCLDGTIEMTLTSTGPVSNIIPIIGVLDIPFLFKNVAAARAALDGDIGDELANAAQAKGVNVLAWSENGLRHMTANRPIRRPEDLVGLKMRVPQSDAELIGFRALGADPRQIPFQDLYEALRTGEVEAQENPLGVIEASGFSQVQKFLSLTGHVYSANPILAAQDLLDDLSPDQYLALKDCAQKAAIASRQAADLAQNQGPARLRTTGMTVVEDVDIAAFTKAAQPNLTSMGEKFGHGLINRLHGFST